MPNRTENSSTWSMSPLAKASTALEEMMFSRKSNVVSCGAVRSIATRPLVFNCAGLMFMPAPDCTTLTAIMPMSRATVVTTSK